MTSDTPLDEALAQAERILRADFNGAGTSPHTRREIADVIARAREERIGYIADVLAVADHVAVPVAELEALREWWIGDDSNNLVDDVNPFDALIARIPEPEWEPSDELVEAIRQADLGGLVMTSGERDAILRALHAAGLLREDQDGEEN